MIPDIRRNINMDGNNSNSIHNIHHQQKQKQKQKQKQRNNNHRSTHHHHHHNRLHPIFCHRITYWMIFVIFEIGMFHFVYLRFSSLNETTTETGIIRNTIIDNNNYNNDDDDKDKGYPIDIEEKGYPFDTSLHNYETSAVRSEGKFLITSCHYNYLKLITYYLELN